MSSGTSAFGSATLVLQGPGGKVRFEVDADRTTVGRTRDNDIVLQDPAVSSHHCELKADRRGLIILDLDSSNGTYVNGRRVQSVAIYDGDALKIGQFQGRIAVRRFDGKPLKPPAKWGATLAVSLAIALVIGGIVGGFLLVKGRKDADQELFARYEAAAKVLLAADACAEVTHAARELARIGSDLGEPQLGRRGRVLNVSQRRANEAILERSKAREPVVAVALKASENVVTAHRTGIAELQALTSQFNDAGVASSVKKLETIYASRLQSAEDVLSRLKKHADQLAEFNGLVDRRIQSAERDAHDLLNGYRFRLEPLKLGEECHKNFAASQQEGLLQLAGITL